MTRGLCVEGRTSSHAFGLFCRMFALADAFPVHYVPAPRAAFRARRSNLRPVACSRKLRDELATEHRQIVGLASGPACRRLIMTALVRVAD
jgi:hypothetical protein